jgi:putative flavoprotein involved in K+ transport
MRHIDTLIVGGGQAGLAMSRCLSGRGIDHVILERGRIAERWRSERWDSLRLLSPNWQTRLPGMQYDGPDPDGFMTAAELTDFLDRYARSFSAPVRSGWSVNRVTPEGEGFSVQTDRDRWFARSVVVATGYCDIPAVPAMSKKLPADVVQLTPSTYRRPSQLPDGGVLVVGASSSGVQIADELRAAGRHVVVAAGHHLRLPRRYRERDIMWWLDRSGILDETEDDVYDIAVSRGQPSFQLVGRPDHASLDLSILKDRGVEITGRLQGIEDGVVRFADDLVATTAASDAKLALLLARLDAFAVESGFDRQAGPPEPFEPTWHRFVEASASLNLRRAGIATVVWATGYTRRYPWLQVPVLGNRGEIVNQRGVTAQPGLFVIGLRFQFRRNSNFIGGVGKDAIVLSQSVAAHLDRRQPAVA